MKKREIFIRDTRNLTESYMQLNDFLDKYHAYSWYLTIENIEKDNITQIVFHNDLMEVMNDLGKGRMFKKINGTYCERV